ncbi:MAG: hypothetical protein ACLFPF_03525 [Halanaerobiales bacterium]
MINYLIINSNKLAFFINPVILNGKQDITEDIQENEVLSTYWSDNYFNLLPGKSTSIGAYNIFKAGAGNANQKFSFY